MIEEILGALTNDESKRMFDERVVRPCVEYVERRTKVAIGIFYAIGIVVLVQALVVLFVLIRQLTDRRS